MRSLEACEHPQSRVGSRVDAGTAGARRTVLAVLSVALALPSAPAFAVQGFQLAPAAEVRFPPNILETDFEWGDGLIQDIASVYAHPSGDAQSMRVWIAGGRRRQTFRVGDRERLFHEENQALFDKTLRAVEVGPLEDVLYTATDGAVERDAIRLDGTLDPLLHESWTIFDLVDAEVIRDVAVVDDPIDGEGLLVLTTARLVALAYDESQPVGARLVERGELSMPPAFKLMTQMRAHAGPDGVWRAYVLGAIAKPGFAISKPVAKSLTVAHLDFPKTTGAVFEGLAWASPNEAWNPEDLDTQDAPSSDWFEVKIGPVAGPGFLPNELVTSNTGANGFVKSVAAGVVYVVQPAGGWIGSTSMTGIQSGSTAPVLSVVSYKGASIANFELENRGSNVYAFLAVGRVRQVTVLDVSSGSADTFVHLGRWSFDSILPAGLPTVSSVHRIPDLANRLVAVLENSVHLIDSTNLPQGVQNAVQVGVHASGFFLSKKAPKNEHVVMKYDDALGADRFVLWTAGYSAEPYGYALREFRLIDAGGAAPGVYLNGSMYAFTATDGVDAVVGATPRATRLYVPGFSGVIQYRTAGSGQPHAFEPVMSSYVPASPTGLGTDVHITEHQALASISPTDHRLITDSSTGAFLEFPLVGPNLVPSTPKLHSPPPALFSDLNSHFPPGMEPNWSPSDIRYSNEICFQEVGGKSYAIYDVTNRSFTNPLHNLGGMVGLFARQIDPPPADDLEGWNIAIASGPVVGDNNGLVSVCCDTNEAFGVIGFAHGNLPGGFAVFDLSGITGNDFANVEATDVVAVAPFGGVSGIMMNPERNRIWVALTDHEDSENAGVAIYGLDQSTGKVTNGGLPIAKMFEDDGDFPPEFPMGDAFHLRLGPRLLGRERAFVGNGDGGIYELLYRPGGGMSLNGVWHSKYALTGADDEGYHGEITECHVYDLGYGPRVLVAKTTESFAIVEPSATIAGH